MMPPQQETTSVTANGGASNIMLTNRTESVLVHAEPPGSPSHVSSCIEDRIPDHQHPTSSTPARFSILRESLRPVTLKFEDVAYSVTLRSNNGCFAAHEPKTTRTVLNGVSGIVRPGELLAMLGPSGSGKTTLLTALGGRLPGKVSGTITYNSQPFSSSMKRKTGFVTQDDVLYPHLTVLETLTYAALLRLPKKLTRQDKIEQAELIIVELGLTRCRNNIVGGPLFRGVSGGERKRISIGQEMLVNPSLLLLDEPTSGLDSTTAQRIVATLRGLARGGRTVVTTIHQPSSRLYRMFDKVVVLSDGCPIFSGHAGQAMDYFGSIGYAPGFSFVNPADFLLDLANGIAPDTRQDDPMDFHGRVDHPDEQNSTKQFLVSSYKKNICPALKAEISQNFGHPILPTTRTSSPRSSECQWTSSWWEQFKVLFRRGLRERKHESYSGLRIFQVMSVSILSGLLWWHSDTAHMQDQVGLIFFFSIFWGFFPLFNAIFAFPQEQPMLIKERSSGMYRLSSYFFARMAGDLPMELVLPTIFVTITYWMGGLKPSLITFALTLLIILYNVLVSQGLGLALGAILMDVKQATTLASVTMLVFLLAGGYYIQHIPPFIAWLKYVSFSHYCYNLLVGVQYSANETYECGLGIHCKVMDFPGIKYLDLDNKWRDVAALTVMLVGYRLLAYVALRMGQPH
ncbi:ABC_tran domain-containing protein/ABC2_membrane domain-containing protein [Cephalotus follicularis]|uniref:ABC_tran domain-containing protein/ABC2_membrane domain-containing protein n=1 Tax=Cephalotus follicularis TaxID=3775 RepID=A0A1Q3BZ47_CEPFO|nr:ABC_tran domain-containing protein/ABC2_membrane domain-containing protein [Cephalotus follicularis]